MPTRPTAGKEVAGAAQAAQAACSLRGGHIRHGTVMHKK